MHTLFPALLSLALSATAAAETACPAALDFHHRPLTGSEELHLCEAFGGRVVLVVNTASKCAYTPQYEGLEALYERYRARGLVVAGFPSNDFGGQEPGTEQQVSDFCRLTYGVRFPMFAKTRIRGPEPAPFYAHLMAVTGDTPRWNFHKYLLDRQGRVVGSFPSQVTPDDARLVEAIEALL
ncbi:MAG: glutathione peroxidase [Gammaproteobacteria bacterium]